MAYSRYNWGVNEVITSTPRLNAMEVGIEEAYLWSEAVIDGDKDMGANDLTNVNVYANNFKTYASDFVKVTLLPDPVTKWQTNSSFLVQVAEFRIPPGIGAGSTVRVKSTAQAAGSGSYRVYVNGAAVGTLHAVGSPAVYSDDITLNPGDLLQFWALNTGGAGATAVTQVQFCYYDGFDYWEETS